MVPPALGGLVLALDQTKMWVPPHWVLWAAVASGTASVLAEGVVEVFRREHRSGDPYESGDRQKFMSSCAVQIHQQADIPVASLGVSLWVVHCPRRRPSALLSAFLGGEQCPPERFLWRVERYRASNPTATSEEWASGRGVIGRCVKENAQAFRDYRPLQRQHPLDSEISKAQWKTIQKEGRDDGFAQKDFLRLIHRYEQVFAYPITDGDGRIVGCVSVDVTAEDPLLGLPDHPTLNAKSVVSTIDNLARSMSTTATKLAVRP